MTDIAALSFSINSEPARDARRNLDEMRSAARDAAQQAQDMSRGFERSMETTKAFTAGITDFAKSTREAATGIEALVDRVNKLALATSGLSGPLKELQQAYGQLEGAAKVFGTTAAGLEAFSRQARQVGLDGQETVNALRRIQQALEGITAEGRQARAVLESYGVAVAGLGRGDADRVLRDFVSRSRLYQDDAMSRADIQSVLGPMSGEGFAALANPAYRTIEQTARGDREREGRRVAGVTRDAAARGLFELQRRQDELADLEREWSRAEDGWVGNLPGVGWLFRRQGVFQSDADRLRTLRAAQSEGTARGDLPYSQSLMGRFNAAQAGGLGLPAVPIGPAGFLSTGIAATRMGQEYWASPGFAANNMALDWLYEQNAESDWTPLNIASRTASLFRRGRLAFGDTSVVPTLPRDSRPVNERLTGMQQQNQALLAAARMTPAELSRREAYEMAAGSFGIGTAGWERMTADQIAALGWGNGGFSDGQRTVADSFIRLRESNANIRFDEALGPSRAARSAWSSTIAGGGTSVDGDRAAYAAQAEARARRELVDVSERERRVKLELAEYDAQRLSQVERMTQLVREQTQVTVAYTEAAARTLTGGGGASAATTAGIRAQATEAARVNPAISADARLQSGFEQSYAQALSQAVAQAAQLQRLEEQSLGLSRGRLAAASEETAVIAKHVELHEALARAEALSGQARQDALTKLREISAELDKQKTRAEEIRTALLGWGNVNLAFMRVDDANVLGRGRPGFPAAQPGEETGIPGLRQEEFLRSEALKLFGNDERVTRYATPQEQGRAAAGLLSDTQRRAINDRWTLQNTDPSRVVTIDLQQQIARLRAQPGPMTGDRARRIAELEAQIAGLPEGMRLLEGAGAAGLANAQLGGASAATLYGSTTSLRVAEMGADWAAGRGPGAITGNTLGDRYGRLYGRDAVEMAGDAYSRIRAGSLGEGDAATFLLQETARRAALALDEFSKRVDANAIAIAESEERISAGSPYQRAMLRAEQGVRPEQARLRGLAANATDPDERRRLLAAADALPGQARSLTRAQLRERFTEEGETLDDEVDMASFERDNWWRSSWSLRRESAMRQTRRRLQRQYGDSISGEELEDRVQKSGQVAQFNELNRVTQSVREAMLGMGQAATSALEQIILRGGSAKQVMASLLATMASVGLRSLGGAAASSAFEWLGGRIFGGGAGAAGGAVNAAVASSGWTSAAGVASVVTGGGIWNQGGVFHGGEVVPFAAGGVVDRPTYFPLSGGRTGLMGEAGAEAILPLRRGADGRLGVAATGGGGGIVQNITVNAGGGGGGGGGGAPSPEYLRQVSEAVRRAAREAAEDAMANQMRLGGMLNPVGGGY